MTINKDQDHEHDGMEQMGKDWSKKRLKRKIEVEKELG
jgi:hypothetical protein